MIRQRCWTHWVSHSESRVFGQAQDLYLLSRDLPERCCARRNTEIRRAILSYETSDGWEVAKLAFGPEGRRVIEGEAEAIRGMPAGLPGIPRVLGVHHGPEFTMLRMPYEKGRSFTPRDVDDAICLLDAWIPDQPAVEITCFPEWPMIEGALEGFENREEVIAALTAQQLVPMVRHGDFARWNLIRRRDGSVVVLDWEWGHPAGMPGLDLVHFVLQDARLVARMEAAEAIAHTMDLLARPPFCEHLRRCGWLDSPLLPILASLAWKQGAGHQDNTEILQMALAMAEQISKTR